MERLSIFCQEGFAARDVDGLTSQDIGSVGKNEGEHCGLYEPLKAGFFNHCGAYRGQLDLQRDRTSFSRLRLSTSMAADSKSRNRDIWQSVDGTAA